ncbi:MAG: hypothetical protein JXA82_07320 [Sedimentisphaerales bacterium]|nr:hypothetical protein [Sedimentisphaerales bacterium]
MIHINRLYRYYPPRIFIFYPLYKVLRRRIGFSMPVSNFLVWTISALLHGIPMALLGSPIAGIVCGVILFFLGLLSTIVILFKKPTRRGRSTSLQSGTE